MAMGKIALVLVAFFSLLSYRSTGRINGSIDSRPVFPLFVTADRVYWVFAGISRCQTVFPAVYICADPVYQCCFFKKILLSLRVSPSTWHLKHIIIIISSLKSRLKQKLLIALLLLISGNVQPNPGPETSFETPADFKIRTGLGFLHLNVRSLVNKKDMV